MASSPTDPFQFPEVPRAWLALCGLTTALIVGWILRYTGYGVDFTDEGYYLVSIARPSSYQSVTQFGFIYHPLYAALGGGVASLRFANIAIIFALAWILSATLLKSAVRAERAVVSAGLAIVSLIAFDPWLPTPSYNSLAFQALLLSCVGLLSIGPTGMGRWGAVWVGIGGWLAFMAKPSTALALAIAAVLHLVWCRRFSVRTAVLAAVSALAPLWASALWIDGSAGNFVARLRTGLRFAGYAESGHTFGKIFRFDYFKLSGGEWALTLGVAAFAFLGAWGAGARKTYWRALAGAIAAGFAAIVVLAMGTTPSPAGSGFFRRLMIWAVVFACVVLASCADGWKTIFSVPRARWGDAALLAGMPYFYAFGTNGNYWWAASAVGIFWVLAGFALLASLADRRRGWAFALPIVFAAQAASTALLRSGMDEPYRQPQPLRLNDRTVEFGAAGSKLTLSAGYAAYVETARTAARAAGFAPGMPLIDLTGQSPGLLYALQAHNLGQAWIVGGYPGSLRLATATLALAPCATTASAWLLTEPAGPRRIPDELLASFGARLARDYEPVAAWSTAEGAGGYPDAREQLLYRPRRIADVTAACMHLDRAQIP